MDTMLFERPTDEHPLRAIWPKKPWSRRRRILTVTVISLAVVVAGAGWWWHHSVTADPGLRFQGAGLNVFRAVGDRGGVEERHNLVGEEARVTFEADGTFFAWAGLHNASSRDLRIEAIDPVGFYYFGLERAVAATDPDDQFPDGDQPLEPFTLPAGETRHVRLEFRMADCDPAGLQDGTTWIAALPVTYHVFGFTRTLEIPFDRTVISVDTIGRCDQPME